MSNLTYDIPVNRRVASILKQYERLQPDPTYFPTRDSYHMIGGGREVLHGDSGHYHPVYSDEMSVSGFPLLPGMKPIGLPKPLGAGRSGGKKIKAIRHLEQFGEYIKPIGKPLVELTQKVIQKQIDKLDKKKGRGISGGAHSGGSKSGGSKQQLRGQMVSRLMKERGLSLGEASRYIKENDLM
jgi:hypothetical protein